MRLAMGAALAAVMLAGCATDQTAAAGDTAQPATTGEAVAMLRSSTGSEAGRATVRAVAGGLEVNVNAVGLTPGVHGVHIHTTGACDAPAFTSAGGHWNPTAKQHGSQNPMGPHEGDLPNLTAAADGSGSLTVTLTGATLAGLMDADGAALVIHAGPDDLRTDPAGNSGGRIACGVFSAA